MDRLEFDEATAAALEVVYATRDVLRRRRLVREALAVRPGERILDVGCGPGFYVAELLEAAGPDGAALGVDPSGAMLALAARRCEGLPNVELREGDATALPVEDASFDAALCVQVLEYVPDVAAALAELHRALRPGGRVVIWDVDWATVSMSAADRERHERVLRAWDRHLVHRSLPMTLAAQLREAGFEDVSAEGHAFTTTELVPDAYGGSLVAVVQTYLHGLEDFPDEEAAAWGDEQRALGDAGRFYFSCVQCCFAARR
ncbi:MAG TPA: methyltransferase domain-containing protein [Solirubrobacteraceae bacterium]|nr:methyltransferase domain-containing protein [Solirubrobacteraceae bacterium]